MTAAQITYREVGTPNRPRIAIYVDGQHQGHLTQTVDRTYQAVLNVGAVIWARTMPELEADITEYLHPTPEEEDY